MWINGPWPEIPRHQVGEMVSLVTVSFSDINQTGHSPIQPAMPQSPFVMRPSSLNGSPLVSKGAEAGRGVPDGADCTGLAML